MRKENKGFTSELFGFFVRHLESQSPLSSYFILGQDCGYKVVVETPVVEVLVDRYWKLPVVFLNLAGKQTWALKFEMDEIQLINFSSSKNIIYRSK